MPVNVRFACDGEEETGGHSIVEFLEADERGADAAIIFDSGMIGEDVPAFNIATRGLVYFHVELRSGARDLHSGMFGGAALNAAHALIRTLDKLIAADGRLVEPLREGIIAPYGSRSSRIGSGCQRRGRAGRAGRAPRRPGRRRGVLHPHDAPSLRWMSTGSSAGSPHLEKTVLPVRAVANVSVRLAPGPAARGDRRRVRAADPRGRA